MIRLLHLNKLILFILFLSISIFNLLSAEEAADIWKNKDNQNQNKNITDNEKKNNNKKSNFI